MRRAVALLIFPIIVSFTQCSPPGDPHITEINELNQKDPDFGHIANQYTRAQTAYHVHGLINKKDRQQKVGQYYNIHWKDTQPDKDLLLKFNYTQTITGSKVQTKSYSLPAGRSGGSTTTEIPFTGDDYLKNGRVMSWEALLIDPSTGKNYSRRTSYLWR